MILLVPSSHSIENFNINTKFYNFQVCAAQVWNSTLSFNNQTHTRGIVTSLVTKLESKKQLRIGAMPRQ